MFRRTLSSLGAAALMLGTAALATPLHAAAPDDSVRIQYGDLDLSQDRDVARLERRVKQAANGLCIDGSRTIAALRMAAACKADVLSRAEPHVRTAVASHRKRNNTRLALVIQR